MTSIEVQAQGQAQVVQPRLLSPLGALNLEAELEIGDSKYDEAHEKANEVPMPQLTGSFLRQ